MRPALVAIRDWSRKEIGDTDQRREGRGTTRMQKNADLQKQDRASSVAVQPTRTSARVCAGGKHGRLVRRRGNRNLGDRDLSASLCLSFGRASACGYQSTQHAFRSDRRRLTGGGQGSDKFRSEETFFSQHFTIQHVWLRVSPKLRTKDHIELISIMPPATPRIGYLGTDSLRDPKSPTTTETHIRDIEVTDTEIEIRLTSGKTTQEAATAEEGDGEEPGMMKSATTRGDATR